MATIWPVNAVPSALPEQADMSHITQQYTLVLQVLDLDCELLLKAQSVAAKSQGQYKAETFLLPQAELAQLSLASAKLVALQGRMKHLDRVERGLDLALRQPAGTMESWIYSKLYRQQRASLKLQPPPQASRK